MISNSIFRGGGKVKGAEWVYTHRIIGGDCDHCRIDGIVGGCRSKGPRNRKFHGFRQQHAEYWFGNYKLFSSK